MEGAVAGESLGVDPRISFGYRTDALFVAGSGLLRGYAPNSEAYDEFLKEGLDEDLFQQNLAELAKLGMYQEIPCYLRP